LNYALNELENFNDEFVSIEVLFYSMMYSADAIGTYFKDIKISQKQVKQAIMDLRNGQNVTSNSQEGTYKSLEKYAKI
jgi:ATP-dependent Clp protease ATP-binding subunit ClpB